MCIVGIDQAQWSRPDEDGSNNPSIEAWRGVETVRAVDAFSAILGTETKKKTVLRTTSRRNETKKETVLRTFSENRQGVRRRRWLSADARKWLRQSARQQRQVFDFFLPQGSARRSLVGPGKRVRTRPAFCSGFTNQQDPLSPRWSGLVTSSR